MQYTKTKNGFMIRLVKEEEVAPTLIDFCVKQNIRSGFFQALGAVSTVELSYYHLDKKEYSLKTISQDLEIVALTGNVATVDGKQVTHMHGVFSNEEFVCFGGHINKAVVSATCEVYLTDFETEITREMDSEIGLKLLNCSVK